MARNASVPALIVTYEELLERRSIISKYGAGEDEDDEGVGDRDGSLVDRTSCDCGNDPSRHGLLQLKPTQREAMDRERRQEGSSGRRGAKNKAGGRREIVHHSRSPGEHERKERASERSRMQVTVGERDVTLEWSSKEGELENLLSRWAGSPVNLGRIVHSWYVPYTHLYGFLTIQQLQIIVSEPAPPKALHV